MNFQKISDYELRCSVSAEEIKANGLEVSDFLRRSDKSYEFFEYLVQEGQMETGFDKSGPMSVEGIFLNGNLELLFRAMSEEEADFWEECADMLPALPDQDQDPEEDGVIKLVQVRFRSPERLCKFCRLFPPAEKTPSSLYEMDGSYVLLIDLEKCTKQEIGAFCLLANEYGGESVYGDLQASLVMEHGRHICDGALFRLHEGFQA